VEIDLLHTKDPLGIIRSLRDEPVVFITSSHLFFDKKNFSTIYQFEGEIISPLEVIDYLKPIKKIYYPHDLGEPMLPYDLHLISQFDVILSPLPYLSKYKSFNLDVVEVGWIKKRNTLKTKILTQNPKIAHAMSDFVMYYNKGFEKTIEYWGKLWKNGVKVKLPDWYGSQKFEEEFPKYQVIFYPSTLNIIDIINENDIIITNGKTSVSYEAALSGKLTLNILENPILRTLQKNKFIGVQNIKFFSMDECLKYISEKHYLSDQLDISMAVDRLKPFNFKLAEQILSK
jgi:hypothetical protein